MQSIAVMLLALVGFVSQAFAYSSPSYASSSSTKLAPAMAYILKDDGSVVRTSLLDGTSLPLIPARTSSSHALAIGTYGRVQVFTDDYAGLVRVKPLLTGANLDTVQPALPAVKSMAMGMYDLYELNTDGTTSRIVHHPFPAASTDTLATLSGYDPIALEYHYPTSTQIFALLHKQSTGATTILGYYQGGSLISTLLQSSDTLRDLRGLAQDTTADTLWSFDQGSAKFVKISISGNTVTPTALGADSVSDMHIAKDGSLWWSNKQGLWHAVGNTNTVQVIASMAIISFKIDDQNIQPSFTSKRMFASRFAPIGGGTELDYLGSMSNDGDSLSCEAIPYGTLKGTLYPNPNNTYPCNFFFIQNAGTPPQNSYDSLRFVLADQRGGSDTMIYLWMYNINNSPAISAPTAITAYANNDSYTTIQISSDANEPRNTALLHDLDSIKNVAVDTLCPTQTASWFLQSFQTGTTSGTISEITAGLRFKEPVRVSLIYGNAWTPGVTYVYWSNVYLPNTSSLLQTWPIYNGYQLSPYTTYSLVFEPLGSHTGQVCFENTGAYAGGYMQSADNPTSNTRDMYFKIFESENFSSQWAHLLNGNADTMTIAILAPKSAVGQTYPFRIIADDGAQATASSFKVTVANGSLPAFKAPAQARVAHRNYSSDPSAFIYNWMTTELPWSPRSYAVQILDSAKWQSAPSVDYSGNLSATVAIGAVGIARFLIQRCQSDTSLCSNWDTASILISTPPTIQVAMPDSVEAGTTVQVPMTVTDPDPGDSAFVNVSWAGIKRLARTSGGTGYATCGVCVQTFQAKSAGSLRALRVDAAFARDTVQVSIQKITNLTDYSYWQSSTQISALAKTAGTAMQWQYLDLGNYVSLDSGALYAITLGNPYAPAPDSIRWSWAPDSIAGSNFQFQNSSGQTTPIDGTKDFSFEVPAEMTWPSFIGLSRNSGLAYALSLSPMPADTGNYPVVFRANDGTGSSAAYATIHVTPSNVVPTITHEQVIRIAAAPEGMWQTKKYWISSATGAMFTPTYQTKFATTADSNFFAGNLPSITSTGTLSLFEPASSGGSGTSIGTGAFMLRACLAKCSAWDTVKVRIMAWPSFTLPALDSVRANSNTNLVIRILDANYPTLDSVTLQENWLFQNVMQSAQNGLYKSSLASQNVSFSTYTNPGEIRVYAKFPKNYVRVTIKDASQTAIASTPAANLFVNQFYVAVTPDILQWQSIPIPYNIQLDPSKTWRIELGSAQSSDTIVWGVDSTHTNAGTSFDDNSTSVTGASINTSITTPALAFELWARSSPPPWSNIGDSSRVKLWRVHPASSDTGHFRLLFSVSNGIAAVGVVRNLRVFADSSKHDSTQRGYGIAVNTDGPSVQFIANGIRSNSIFQGASIQLKIQGGTVDTTFTMQGDSATWAPAPYGDYLLTWSIINPTTGLVLLTKTQTFSLTLNVFTPPKLQTWYMVGFGSQPFDFSSLKSSSLVFGWNDKVATSSQGRYASRNELVSSQVGRGYWYYTEDPDTLTMPLITGIPAPVVDSLFNGGTGWNIIANPWPWSIALDSAHTYWQWVPETNGYQIVTSINSYMAAWVNTPNDATITLQPRPVFHAGQKTLARKNAPLFASVQDWSVQAKLESGAQSDIWNFLGITSQEPTANDISSSLEPPAAMGDRVALSFVRNGTALARDMIAPQESAHWILNLSAERTRDATLNFSGVSALQNVGLKLVFISADGSVQQISEGAPVHVSLRKGSTQASVQAIPSSEVIQTAFIQHLQVTSVSSGYEIHFNASLALSGKQAYAEWVDVNGQVIWQSQFALSAGSNSITTNLSPHAGVSLVHVRCASQKMTTTVFIP